MIHRLTAVALVMPSCLRNTDWEERVLRVARKLQNGWKLLNVDLQLSLVQLCPEGLLRHVLVGGNVIDFHRVGQARVSHTGSHVDFVLVHSSSKQRPGSFHGSQLLPLKLGWVVDTHILQALPTER